MGQTITQKILAAHAGRDEVAPGEILNVRLDGILVNELSAMVAIKEFRRAGLTEIPYADRVIVVPDHFMPAKDLRSAEVGKIVREFVKEHAIEHYFEIGDMGIEHVLLPEKGLIVPGDTLIGGDSHTCTHGAFGAFATGVGSTDIAAAFALGECWVRVPETIRVNFHGERRPWIMGKDFILHLIGEIGVDGATYCTLEFGGDAIDALPLADRITICNMSVEAGAKNGICHADEKTLEYVRARAAREPVVYASDPDCEYQRVIDIDVSAIEPVVALPSSPGNAVPISEVGDVKLDQIVLGSCTNGRIEDLRLAAEILKGRRRNPETRVIILPGSQEVFLNCVKEGLAEIFVEAGCVFSTPTCGPCIGGHMGVLAEGETCLTTTSRNFTGRMGHVKSEVYLSSPVVAAASAVAGRIVSPEHVAAEVATA
jgi:3-isopropylmalate/(R)-2-methylmalate dehydratase large subunit